VIDTDATTARAAWCERTSYINGNELRDKSERMLRNERTDGEDEDEGTHTSERSFMRLTRHVSAIVLGVRLDEINERQWTPTVAS